MVAHSGGLILDTMQESKYNAVSASGRMQGSFFGHLALSMPMLRTRTGINDHRSSMID